MRKNRPRDASLFLLVAVVLLIVIWAVLYFVEQTSHQLGPFSYMFKCSNCTVCDLTNYGALSLGLISSVIIVIIVWISQIGQSGRSEINRNVTEKIYTRTISHYAITMKYYEKDNNVVTTENKLNCFHKLVNSLVQQGKTVKDIEISGKGKGKEIELDKGTVKITIPEIMESSSPQKTCKRSVRLYLQTESYRLLDEIITEHQLAYSHLEWHIVDPYPVEPMMIKIKSSARDLPGHVFEDITVDEPSRAIIHKIAEFNTIKIYAAIYHHSMNLICSDEGSIQGFHRAHQLFTPAKIISILFDEIESGEVKKLSKNAMKLKAN